MGGNNFFFFYFFLLSQVGNEILLKAIIQAIPTYIMSVSIAKNFIQAN